MSFTESVDELVAADESGLLGVHPTWVRVRIAEICSILNGFPFPSKQFKPSGGMPLIRIRDVVRGRTDTHFVGDFDRTFIVRHGELVVGMDGDFNCALWSGGDALLNQRVCKLTPDDRHYDLRLLAHALPGYLGAINSKTSAITVKHLSSKTVAEIPLPLPPRREQTRLAEALESYFTRLDDAEATLERVQRNLKRYRASVLTAAVEGRLVPTEAELVRADGRSYEPAAVLLTRILAERRRRWEDAELAKMTAQGKVPKDDKWKAKYVEPVAPDTSEVPELPEGWCWTTLGLLKAFSLYGPRFSSEDYASEGRLVLRTSDISESGKVNLATAPRLHLTDEEFADYKVELGDILVTRTGSLGTLAVFNDTVDAIPGAYLIQFRLVAPLDTSWFCFTFLKSPTGQARLKGGGAGVGRPNLNAPTIEAIPIGLPPLAEQKRILAEVERLLSVVDALEDDVLTNLTRCARLRQATLKWAFEGRLVDQDPTDEPASVLLERIRAERAAVDVTPRRRLRRRMRASG